MTVRKSIIALALLASTTVYGAPDVNITLPAHKSNLPYLMMTPEGTVIIVPNYVTGDPQAAIPMVQDDSKIDSSYNFSTNYLD